MATAAKVNGLTTAGSFFGYDPIFLKITGTNVATADTASVDGVAAFTQGNLSKAVSALQTQMSIVHIGARADDIVVVAIDGATANAYLTANSNTDVAAAAKALIDTATGVTSTVAAITLTAGDLPA
tara:strand:+ start:39 stop:416 length:378 start_codon:yes stop_codon:yes gene_type:complete